MILTDLNELKSVLDIDPNDTSEDQKLSFYVEQASSIIENFLDRPGLTYKSRTEYYNGTGTQKLLLKSRPAFTVPSMQVYVDSNGFYGSTSGAFQGTGSLLTYGNDYCLEIDTDDGISSKCGILVKMKGFWEKPTRRTAGLLSPFIAEDFGSIKVMYYAGYTVDNLPAAFRTAANMLVANLRYMFPLGQPLTGEGYEERSISLSQERKDYLLATVKPLIFQYRNWSF